MLPLQSSTAVHCAAEPSEHAMPSHLGTIKKSHDRLIWIVYVSSALSSTFTDALNYRLYRYRTTKESLLDICQLRTARMYANKRHTILYNTRGYIISHHDHNQDSKKQQTRCRTERVFTSAGLTVIGKDLSSSSHPPLQIPTQKHPLPQTSF